MLNGLALVATSFLLTTTVHATVADQDRDKDAGPANTSESVDEGSEARCVDLTTRCNTVMVNYSGESVEFVYFRHNHSQNSSAEIDTSTHELSDVPPLPRADLPDSESGVPDSSEYHLGMDFLLGFEEKSNTETPAEAFSGYSEGTAEFSTYHNWSAAALASMRSQPPQLSSGAPNATEQTAGRIADFWDIRSIYQWQVEENVMNSDVYDVTQVVLSNIYVSPKITSASDPEIVVCELNNPDNCRPLSD